MLHRIKNQDISQHPRVWTRVLDVSWSGFFSSLPIPLRNYLMKFYCCSYFRKDLTSITDCVHLDWCLRSNGKTYLLQDLLKLLSIFNLFFTWPAKFSLLPDQLLGTNVSLPTHFLDSPKTLLELALDWPQWLISLLKERWSSCGVFLLPLGSLMAVSSRSRASTHSLILLRFPFAVLIIENCDKIR